MMDPTTTGKLAILMKLELSIRTITQKWHPILKPSLSNMASASTSINNKTKPAAIKYPPFKSGLLGKGFESDLDKDNTESQVI